MLRALRPRAVTVLAVLTLLGLTVLAPFGARRADAHGSTQSPASRVYACRFNNPDNSMCAGAWSANSQALYDWMEVNIGDAAGRHRELIPDGQLCSAGRQKYAAFDRPGAWPITALQGDGAGMVDLVYENTAPHATQYYRVYITEEGFDARTDSLSWGDLELVHDSGPLNRAGQQRLRAALPNRAVPAVLYIVWQRSDSPEAFYACSDVTVGSGSVNPPSPGTTTPRPTPSTSRPTTATSAPTTIPSTPAPAPSTSGSPSTSAPVLPPETTPAPVPTSVPTTAPSTPPSTRAPVRPPGSTAPPTTSAVTGPVETGPTTGARSPSSVAGSGRTAGPSAPSGSTASTAAAGTPAASSAPLVVAVADTGGSDVDDDETPASVDALGSTEAPNLEAGLPTQVVATADGQSEANQGVSVGAMAEDDDPIVALSAEVTESEPSGGGRATLFFAAFASALVGLTLLGFGIWRSDHFT